MKIKQSLTREERRARATLAVETSWANTTDRAARTAPARQAQRDRLADEIDPDRKLPAEELERRVDHLRRAHLARMSLQGQKARRLKKEAREAAERHATEQEAIEATYDEALDCAPETS